MKKREYVDNSLKKYKMIAAILMITAVLILTCAVSTVDYEVETRMPEEERMTQGELAERIVIAAFFGTAGLFLNYVVNREEEALYRFDKKNNRKRYEEW